MSDGEMLYVCQEHNVIATNDDCHSQIDLISSDKSLWWMSFCDCTLPQGHQFVGALVLEVPPKVSPITHSHALKLNPGGEIRFFKVPSRYHAKVPSSVRNRILSKEEASSFDQQRN